MPSNPHIGSRMLTQIYASKTSSRTCFAKCWLLPAAVFAFYGCGKTPRHRPHHRAPQTPPPPAMPMTSPP